MNLANFFYTIASFLGIIALLKISKTILLPFLIAMFIWSLINAINDALSFIIPRHPKTSFTISIIGFIGLLWFPYQLSLVTIPKVIEAAPTYQKNFQQKTLALAELINMEQNDIFNLLYSKINITEIVSQVASLVASFTGNTVVVAIYLIFIFLEQNIFSKKIDFMFKKEITTDLVRNIIHNIYVRIQAYIWVKTFLSTCTSILSYLVFKFIGVDIPEFWAFMIFLLNFIPNIGPIISVGLPTLLTFIQFDTIFPCLMLATLLTIINIIIGNVIEPRMMGQSLNLSPLILLISLVVWGQIWGITGAFLSVPIMVVILIVLSEFESTKPFAVILSEKGIIKSSS
jgi:AI-2 transport protein TqsA